MDNNDGHYSRNRTDAFCNDVILGMRAHLKFFLQARFIVRYFLLFKKTVWQQQGESQQMCKK